MFQPSRPSPEIDIDQALNDLKKRFGAFFGRFGGGGVPILFVGMAVAVVVAIWLLTGFYQVQAQEKAARRLFGQYTPPLQDPGLHWYWPRPVGKISKEVVTETRRMELGFRSVGGGQVTEVSSEALMITGDLNIANVQVVVQYRISDLEAFLFNVADPGDPERRVRLGAPDGETLKDATEAAMREVVGQRSIDDVLTINREAVQADTLRLLRILLDDYKTGIQVLEVRLQNVSPPAPVRDAFDDVVRARVDKEARINQALAYQQDQVPKAKGDAQRITQAAEAYKQERILRATGEANRFLSNLREYEKSKDVTRWRLYLEAMEVVLPGIQKFVLAPGAGGNVLPLLTLQQQQQAASQAK
ncbi:MAG: FtsH protease activity modulator HflK [Chloroflexi bacterium]|nr:FtsH protease activity modulator HflK [Chloroflexota bacterium]